MPHASELANGDVDKIPEVSKLRCRGTLPILFNIAAQLKAKLRNRENTPLPDFAELLTPDASPLATAPTLATTAAPSFAFDPEDLAPPVLGSVFAGTAGCFSPASRCFSAAITLGA